MRRIAVSLADTTLSGSGTSYTLNLKSVTSLAGNYVLTLVAAGSGITDADGDTFAADTQDQNAQSLMGRVQLPEPCLRGLDSFRDNDFTTYRHMLMVFALSCLLAQKLGRTVSAYRSDIGAFYEAFAFQPETEETPDHLTVEAGFLGYLCLKQAYARTRGNEEEAEVAAQAAHRFREDHLATFTWPVAERLESAGVRYLSLAASALAHRSGPHRHAGPTIPVPRPTCDDCSMECGQE